MRGEFAIIKRLQQGENKQGSLYRGKEKDFDRAPRCIWMQLLNNEWDEYIKKGERETKWQQTEKSKSGELGEDHRLKQKQY